MNSTGAPPLLEVTGLKAGYGDTPVVRDLTFSVGAGEIVALLGPNGAGKTTTLLSLSNLVPAMDGSATALGMDVRKTPPERLVRAGLAHVPEDRSLFTRLTVRENLLLAASGKDRVIHEVLDFFPALRSMTGRRVGSLSGGEQQMLAIGRALAQRPKILMIDEMSLGLAPLIVQDLLRIVRRIADESATGILLVEQHVHLALAVADRALVLVHGRVTTQGNAQDLRSDSSLLQSYLGNPLEAEETPMVEPSNNGPKK